MCLKPQLFKKEEVAGVENLAILKSLWVAQLPRRLFFEGIRMKSIVRNIARMGVLTMLLSPTVNAAKVTPGADMTAAQARQAILLGAERLLVPVQRNVHEAIKPKSVLISRMQIVFSGANANEYNGGLHTYITASEGDANLTRLQSQSGPCIIRSDGRQCRKSI